MAFASVVAAILRRYFGTYGRIVFVARHRLLHDFSAAAVWQYKLKLYRACNMSRIWIYLDT